MVEPPHNKSERLHRALRSCWADQFYVRASGTSGLTAEHADGVPTALESSPGYLASAPSDRSDRQAAAEPFVSSRAWARREL